MRFSVDFVGANGFKMLAIALLLVIATGGLSLLPALYRVIRFARRPSNPPAAALTVLVPGVRLEHGEIGKDFRLRLERALALFEQGAGPLVVLGGITSPDAPSEAAKGAEYLRSRGVPATKLQIEARSRNSLENLRHARELLGTTLVVIVSNRYHLARLDSLATGLGMAYRLCPAEPQWAWTGRNIVQVISEAFFLHWYWVGHVWARWVRDWDSLRRIT